ncbi:MAG: hypothetical protein KDM81_18945 [Verrucomicrobiae bacterium]|nr:hypothetical protein [Verrucomicrobiae bacterium]
MNPTPCLRRKRVLLPLLALLLLALTGGIACLRSDISSIVVYNQTGAPVTVLRVTACGQTTTFTRLDDDGSVRWKLTPAGSPGAVGLETATDPPWQWQGAYVEPRGGYRVILHLWPDGAVESHVQLSFWRWLLGETPVGDGDQFMPPAARPPQ